jgi:hypothetical protein
MVVGSDRRGRGRQRSDGAGRCSSLFAVGHASSQGSLVLSGRMWFSICRRYAPARNIESLGEDPRARGDRWGRGPSEASRAHVQRGRSHSGLPSGPTTGQERCREVWRRCG